MNGLLYCRHFHSFWLDRNCTDGPKRDSDNNIDDDDDDDDEDEETAMTMMKTLQTSPSSTDLMQCTEMS
jgi:hypothetical protein